MAEIFLGVGSNQDREKNIRSGLINLHYLLDELALSPVYESKSVGFDGSNFFNLVVRASTHLSVGELSQALKKIEDAHGRIRCGAKFSPRSLDIDLLLYEDVVGCFDGVDLPRDEILFNAYVLLPLSDLASHAVHPVVQKSYAQLWKEFPQASQVLWKIDFNL